jgi:hypothetical protein
MVPLNTKLKTINIGKFLFKKVKTIWGGALFGAKERML